MATGTGKTKIAIMASYRLYNILKDKKKKLIIIVSVPDSYGGLDHVVGFLSNIDKVVSEEFVDIGSV